MIEEEDQYGNIETRDDSTVITVSPSTGTAQLAGTSMTMKDGVATFTGLADDTAGTIAFDFSGVGLSTGPSDGVVISPSAAALLVITSSRRRRPSPARPSPSSPSSTKRIDSATSRREMTVRW